MKHPVLCGAAALLLAAGVVSASPTDAAIVAAMKLADQPGYSWTATVVRDARSYTIEGKTLVGGYTQVTVPANIAMPANPGMRGQVGRGSSDSEVLAIFKDDEKHVVETAEGWLTPEELASRPTARTGSGRRRGLVNDLPLKFAVSLPHEDIGIIIASCAGLRVDGDIVSGQLSDTAARLLLLPPGQDEVTPVQAAGAFKLWISNGMLSRYEVQLTGIVTVGPARGGKNVKTTQTVTVDLKDVGTTRLTVPPEAKAKLEP
ncbi:MAG TPA: hypothetical protein VG838_15840 [Opitutaceae bacterium]|nr:hypothetical protein [Opitutaceae bacterium]